MTRKTARLDRRQTLALGGACVAGLTLPPGAGALAATKAPPAFPEPRVNRLIRGIEGLSRRMAWVRTVLLNNLDDYRTLEARLAADGTHDICEADLGLRSRLRENIVGMEIVAELTRTRQAPDRLFREIVGSLGLCPHFGQVPPDPSAGLIAHIEGIAALERAIA
ncbi:MAG: hypothetical protein R3D33_05210 [Hyphomicrobiaceae bacterium]